jgi:formyltetrahydrofolate synthetase
MNNTISFIYVPYIHFEAYKYSLQNLREHYPESDVFIYFDSFRDDIEKYKEIALEYNCKFILRDEKVFYTDRNDSFEINSKKMIEISKRLIHSCENTNSEWMMIFEEDVIIKKKIENFPKADVGTARYYFRPGGGSVFKRLAYLDAIKKADIPKIMETTINGSWAADVVLENVFRLNEATFEEWEELAEAGHRDNLPHSVYHGYKDLYNK